MIVILSIKEIAELSGVSVRTLHYYDSINLLKPTHVTPNGYRHYSSADVEKLQKMILLKEVGLNHIFNGVGYFLRLPVVRR